MARTPIVAANWKMYKTIDEASAFIQEVVPLLAAYPSVEQVICPAYIALPTVSGLLRDTGVKVGAQNAAAQKDGAYTSQISTGMLAGLVDYVILGHSEVRQYLHETDAAINEKVKAVFAAGLTPILAVGESRETNESGGTDTFVAGQVRADLDGVSAEDAARIVIAYEPIWAIGTGLVATKEVAQTIIRGAVRATLEQLYGAQVADAVRIQYGGSVKPDNMRGFMDQPDVDGALVGGASLKVNDFTELIRHASEAKGG